MGADCARARAPRGEGRCGNLAEVPECVADRGPRAVGGDGQRGEARAVVEPQLRGGAGQKRLRFTPLWERRPKVNDVLKCTCSRSVGSPRGPLARAGRRRLWVGAARAAGHQGHSLFGFWWLGRRACSDVSVTTSENTGRRCARTSYRRTCNCDSLVEGQPQPRRRGPRCRAGWASLGRRSHLPVSGARCDCGGGALRRALGSRRAQHAEVRDPAVLGAVRHVARRAGERGGDRALKLSGDSATDSAWVWL